MDGRPVHGERKASIVEDENFINRRLTIEERKASIVKDLESAAETQAKRPSIPIRVSHFTHAWTPFLLISSYFPFSVCFYLVCPHYVIFAFWFIYLATNFYVAGVTVLEAFFSITPTKEARKRIDAAEMEKWAITNGDELGVLDILIVAYLPNEKDIITSRILYMVNHIVYPTGKIRINLLYNTPHPIEPLETELHFLTHSFPHLRVFNVPNSKSKANNLNYFLTQVVDEDTDVIAIYDCDHYPHPHSPRFAMERFATDPSLSIVQGRCIIQNAQHNFLTRMIAVEFDKIYAVSHPGRAAMWNFGLFCGSNGYWRAELLRDLKMDGGMLTEDIDSALRALGRNAKAVHDSNVVSYELAPTQWGGFWKQRLRWAQGWAQASLKHVRMTWTRPVEEQNRSPRVRFGILSLLAVREWSYYLVTQCTCLTFSFVVSEFPRSGPGALRFFFFQYPVAWWLFFLSIICLISTLWITARVLSEFVRKRDMILFSVLYPFYIVVNATIGLYGHARQVARYSSWNPTARK